jgi:diguanylate cyclase (GGDEF)-like protein/PAS domain S-box-containing protein
MGPDDKTAARQPTPHDLREIFDAVPALIGYIDSSLRLRFLNRAFAEWFGRPFEDLAGRPIEEILGPGDFALAGPHMKEALAGTAQKYERTLTLTSGQTCHVVASYVPHRDAGGAIAGFFTLVKDVTKLVESRRELARHRDHLEALVEERTAALRAQVDMRERSERVLRAETQVMELISKGRPLKEVLQALCVMFESFSDAGLCSILVADENAQVLRREISGNLPRDFSQAVAEVPIARACGTSGAAAFTRRVVYADDIATDPNWALHRDTALSNGIRSSWSSPILSASCKVFGTFSVYYRDARHPAPDEQALVERAAHLASIAFERDEAQAHLQYLATHDSLTHLPNRHLFQISLSKTLARVQRTNAKFAVMFIDLDHFKQVNDERGHEVGDALLKVVAQRLTGSVRVDDTICRLGGDEFTAILENVEHIDDVEQLAGKLTAVLSRPFELDGHPVQISCSIGIAVYPFHGGDSHALLKKADVAMYFAKKSGRNRYKTYDPSIDGDADLTGNLEVDLRLALDRDELELHYQPEYEATTHSISGLEALVRWKHPVLGLLGPAQFMPLAEDTGLIVAINKWVIREVCGQNRKWLDAGHRIRIAINMSARLLRQADFAPFLLGLLAQHGVPPALLALDLSESIVMQHDTVAFANLEELKAQGVYVTVCDFGTGYSSLSYLKRLPVDALKIARSFTQDLPGDANAVSIVDALLGLAKTLKLGVTAIGIERADQVDFLAEHGCAHLQGAAISEPLNAQGVGVLLEALAAGRRQPP